MDWPVRFPAEMSAGTISVRSYDPADAAELFESLADERVWEHMSRALPGDAAALDEVIRSRLADGYRATFTVRQGGRVVGITSVLFDPHDPAGAEVGGTLLDPGVWGTGVNTEVKRLLLAVIFRHGAQWAQLRTDERNGRSAAAIRKLGATDLGIRRSTSFAGTAHADGAGSSASTGPDRRCIRYRLICLLTCRNAAQRWAISDGVERCCEAKMWPAWPTMHGELAVN